MTSPAPLRKLPFQAYAFTVLHWVLDDQRDMFDLTPEYQRGSVWTTGQRRALIASLMQGIPVGSITYNVRGLGASGTHAVIDGKQRIEAVRAFCDSEFTVPGWWFEDDEVETRGRDVTFAQLLETGRRRIHMLPMPGLEARVGSVREEAAIYDLLNTAGTAQTVADIERARHVAAG